ncbi:MAG: flavodoxin, partial [Ruminococcus sp.]
TPYTRADLDWTDKKSRSSVETNSPDCRPEIADTLNNMDDYSTVFLGFPIWWYVAPKIIDTFVESYDFSGKTVITFATSGGSGMGKTTDVLKSLCPSASWKNGKVVNGMSEKALGDWADTF